MKERFKSFKQLSAKQKLQYIWDYYKIHIIVTAVLICAIFSIFKTEKNSSSADLYIAYVNIVVDDKLTNALENNSSLSIGSYRDLLITDDPSGDNLEYAYTSSMKLMSTISAGKLDIIIGDSYAMSYAHNAEYLVNMEDYILKNDSSLLDKFKPLFLVDETGIPYAINISELDPFRDAGYTSSVYLGILDTNKGETSVLKLLSALQ